MPRALELFSGTKSFGKWATSQGWEVDSLDNRKSQRPSILADVLLWDHKTLPRDHYAFVWASPCCTHYSIAKTVGVRDLEGADRLVAKTLEVIDWFRPGLIYGWAIENPQTGLLKTRDVIKGIPYYDVTYCEYGAPFKKPTRLWTNVTDFVPRYCKRDGTCGNMANGKHLRSIGGLNHDGRKVNSLDAKHSVPAQLIVELMQCALANPPGAVNAAAE
ncbi:MAG: hypothetical protein ACRECQ_01540 [Burkholderiaceae bacterium]